MALCVRSLAWAAMLLFAACHSPRSALCADGRTCSSNLVCSETHGRCVLPDQVAECEGRADETLCQFGGAVGVCNGGVCFADDCGDGITGPSEACDDGNTTDGDDCSADCRSDESCGNGIVDVTIGEECDCGAGDAIAGGCRLANSAEAGAECRLDCVRHCGDGVTNAAEDCEPDSPPTACLTIGADRGAITCSDTCGFNTASCGFIGWSQIDYGGPFVTVEALRPRGDGRFIGVGSDGLGVRFATLVDIDDGGPTKKLFSSFPPLSDAWVFSSDDILVVGLKGTAARYDGEVLTAMNTGLEPGWNLGSVHATSEDNAVATADGRVLHFDGTSWNVVRDSTLFGTTHTDVWLASATEAFFTLRGTADDVQRVWRHTGSWEAGSWELVHAETGASLSALWGFSGDGLDIYAVGAAGAILHTTDGESWAPMAVPNSDVDLVDVFGEAKDNLYAVGSGGKLWYFDGRGWAEHTLDTQYSLTAVASDQDRVVASTANQGFRYTGSGWVAPIEQFSLALWAFDPDNVWIESGGNVLSWDGAALTALPPSDGLVSSIGRLMGRSPTDAYAVSADKVIYFDGAWADVTPPGLVGEPTGLWVGAASVAVSTSTQVFRDAGAGWVELPAAPHGGLARVWGSGGALYVLSNDNAVGRVLRYDGGWTIEAAEEGEILAAITGFGEDLAAVGASRLAVRTGGVWVEHAVLADDYYFHLAGTSMSDLFAVGLGGTILHFDGTHWSPVRTDALIGLAVAVTDREVLIASESVLRLVRQHPW